MRQAAISGRAQATDPTVAKRAHGLPEQPAQLLESLRFAVVLREVDVYEFAQPRRLDQALLAPKPLKRPLERLGRGLLRGEATALHASRAAPADPIPLRPHRPAVSAASLQFEYLTLRAIASTSSIDGSRKPLRPDRSR
jgi:hypothetical protein